MSWAGALFTPRCVGVVGSVGDGKIGRVLIDQLLDGGFSNVVAVNPKGQGVRGIRGATSFSTLAEDGTTVDLAVIASPANTVATVLEDAGRSGVAAAVIITAGFSEIGHAAEERALLQTARQHGLRLVGPNCAGIVNTRCALFPTLETRPPKGDVAFVSQSGALGGAVLSWAEEQGVGLSKFISYGNAVDLTEADFLNALRDDEDTRVVALYIETVSDGRRFLEAARRLAAAKPLVVIKSGRSDSGGRATQSHTGSMAGSDAVYDAALRQCGAIRVAGIEEMFDVCRGFVHLPPVRGRRIAVVTNSGGPGVLAADAGEAAGLSIGEPSAQTRQILTQFLRPVCGLANPFDLTVQGTEDDYRAALETVLAEYDAAVAINVNTPYLDAAPLARGVVAAAHETGKPVAASFLAGRPAQAALPILEEGGVPNFATGERAMRVLAQMATYVQRLEALPRSPEDAHEPTPQSLPWKRRPTEPEAMDWIEALGVPVIDRRFATTEDDAVRAFRDFGTAVAVKIVSADVVHKTDRGGVALGVSTEEAVAAAFRRMAASVPGGSFEGVLISPMVVRPVEAIVGLSCDRQFGPVVAVGLGGVFTELLHDMSLRIAPVSVSEAQIMIEQLRSVEVLRGARGGVLRDVPALAALVSRISKLPFQFSGLEELDLNPVFVFERGCAAGDVRVIPASGATVQGSD